MKANQTLTDYRKNSGVSQEKLAELLGISRQTVSRWEQGAFTPSAENLAKLSEVFGVPVEAFLKDDWVPPEEKPPEIQVVEIPVEVPVPRPGNYRLWALLAAVVLAAGILVGALFFRERPEDFVPISETESEVVDNLIIGESAPLLPMN